MARLLGSLNLSPAMVPDSDLSDLQEEDVWGLGLVAAEVQDMAKTVLNDDDHDSEGSWEQHVQLPRQQHRPWLPSDPVPTVAMAVPSSGGDHGYRNAIDHQGYRNAVGGSRHAWCREPPQVAMMPQSAPVNIPVWTHRKNGESPNQYRLYPSAAAVNLPNLEGAWDEEERMPPHELSALTHARSGKKSAFSVMEGAGRTLKGRDMRRVRDAVWNQTGFFD